MDLGLAMMFFVMFQEDISLSQTTETQILALDVLKISRIVRKLKILSFYCATLVMSSFLNINCAGSKATKSSNTALNFDSVNNASSALTLPKSQIISKVDKNNQRNLVSENNKSLEEKNKEQLVPAKSENHKNSFSNYIRIKTVYELAMEANPSMFFPHDEFETVSEYKERVSGQVGLMKEIVQMTTQKSEIKKAKRIQVAKEKELKRKAVVETLMSESSSPVEFKPNDIGRYDAENETFPIVLHDTQYQILVPREEARTFKANFERVKIKGLKQLKPQYDVKIKVPKAHIRSRPNGSIIGIASNFNQFEHIQDVDEWYKINYKGQFGFTHKNNANLKLVDIANEYEFHDLVAIHPNTGSLYAMTSVDKLVKAPLNLASRKYESGQPDGPKDY